MIKSNKEYSINGDLVILLEKIILSLESYVKNNNLIKLEKKVNYLDISNNILTELNNLKEVGKSNLDLSNVNSFLDNLDDLLKNNKIGS